MKGTYHFSAFGTPHLVAECGPHCTSYLELPEGTTVVTFDTSPAEYAVPERPGLIEAPANMSAEQIAEIQAAWDAMMQEPAAPHAVRQQAPRLYGYLTGDADA